MTTYISGIFQSDTFQSHTAASLTPATGSYMQIAPSGGAADAYYEVDLNATTGFGGLKVIDSTDGTGAHDWAFHVHRNTNTANIENNGTAYLTIDSSQNTTLTGNAIISVAGKGLQVKEGSNARMGTATLVAGTVTVNNTSVTANTRIFLTIQSLGTVAVAKAIAVTARTASTSFTITSADATDTSVIAWLLIEPAA